MNKRELAELFKFCSPFSILVVTYYNKLIELNCPFTVMVMNDIGNLRIGDVVTVESVKLATNGKTVFVIEDKSYYHSHFDILIDSGYNL